jgi:hypothetical protein
MERINVRSLNECFGIIGDDWINVSDDSHTVIKTIPSWNAGTKGLTTNSKLQKEIARKNAIERNKKYKGGENPRAKTWRIVYIDGKEIIIKALQKWAVDNGYSRAGIKNLAYGKWKKYRDLVTVEEVAQDSTLTE